MRHLTRRAYWSTSIAVALSDWTHKSFGAECPFGTDARYLLRKSKEFSIAIQLVNHRVDPMDVKQSLTVYHIITGLENGGAEGALYRLCVNDSVCKHVVVSLGNTGKFGPLLTSSGIEVHCLEMPRGQVTISGLRRLWKLLRRNRPQVVQTWMYHADLLGGVMARLCGIRQVFWGIRHTTFSKEDSSRSARIAAKICARLSRFVPKEIICVANRSAETHVSMGYASSRMRIIPNGYDLDQFSPDPSARGVLGVSLGIDPDVPLLGFVARYNPQKDHPTLLQALRILRERDLNFACLLIGPGVDEENSSLNRLRDTLGLSGYVHLLGPRPDIPLIMSALDLHVMSSSFGEAFPNVLCEAMACGTPCVSTDVGDAAEIVGDNGWIVPPSQPSTLADVLQRAMSEMGTASFRARQLAGRRRIQERFGIDTMIAAYHMAWFGGRETCQTVSTQ